MTVIAKLVAGALSVLAIGVPMIENWQALSLLAAWLFVIFGERASRVGARKIAVAVTVTAAVIGLKALLPRADMAEAHNAFLVIGEGEALERGLPAPIFDNWKAQFDALYPPDQKPYAPRSQWREQGGVPTTLFTRSSDAIWRGAKYTRQVDTIDFRNLAEFRAGFANELQYNYWAGELLREWMPFYVMYELTPASVGSRFSWQGQLFWERDGGGFDEINHPEEMDRIIAPGDAGKRVYGVFFPKRDPNRPFKLKLGPALSVASWLDVLLGVAGVLAVLALTIRARWRPFARALALALAGYAIMGAFLAISAGKYLGKSYPPHGGGDDGLVHDAWGRTMAMLAGRGHVVEALQGIEPVYWFTPGMRYFRMVEKLMFGDTNHLYALWVVCIPLVVFYLFRHFLVSRLAWAITGVFCILIVGNLSYLNYIANAKLGYGEALAGGLFLLSLVLMLRTQPRWGGSEDSLPVVWGAGAALAAAMFIRPNLAFAVVWLGAAYAWASWGRRDIVSVVVFGSGLALATWLPFHNWYYGGEFYLISKSGSTVSVPLGPGDYALAVRDALHGRLDTTAAVATSRQLQGWLWNPGFLVRPVLTPVAWAFHGIKLLALIVTGWVALRWASRGFAEGTDLAVMAVAALCAHVPMLFIFSTHYRYAMLGWDLSLVVLIVWYVRRGGGPVVTSA